MSVALEFNLYWMATMKILLVTLVIFTISVCNGNPATYQRDEPTAKRNEDFQMTQNFATGDLSTRGHYQIPDTSRHLTEQEYRKFGNDALLVNSQKDTSSFTNDNTNEGITSQSPNPEVVGAFPEKQDDTFFTSSLNQKPQIQKPSFFQQSFGSNSPHFDGHVPQTQELSRQDFSSLGTPDEQEHTSFAEVRRQDIMQNGTPFAEEHRSKIQTGGNRNENNFGARSSSVHDAISLVEKIGYQNQDSFVVPSSHVQNSRTQGRSEETDISRNYRVNENGVNDHVINQHDLKQDHGNGLTRDQSISQNNLRRGYAADQNDLRQNHRIKQEDFIGVHGINQNDFRQDYGINPDDLKRNHGVNQNDLGRDQRINQDDLGGHHGINQNNLRQDHGINQDDLEGHHRINQNDLRRDYVGLNLNEQSLSQVPSSIKQDQIQGSLASQELANQQHNQLLSTFTKGNSFNKELDNFNSKRLSLATIRQPHQTLSEQHRYISTTSQVPTTHSQEILQGRHGGQIADAQLSSQARSKVDPNQRNRIIFKHPEIGIKTRSIPQGLSHHSAVQQPILTLPQFRQTYATAVLLSGPRSVPVIVHKTGSIASPHTTFVSRDSGDLNTASVSQHLKTPYTQYTYHHSL